MNPTVWILLGAMTDMANYGADRNSTIRRSWAQHGLARGGAPLSAKLDRACRLALYEIQASDEDWKIIYLINDRLWVERLVK